MGFGDAHSLGISMTLSTPYTYPEDRFHDNLLARSLPSQTMLNGYFLCFSSSILPSFGPHDLPQRSVTWRRPATCDRGAVPLQWGSDWRHGRGGSEAEHPLAVALRVWRLSRRGRRDWEGLQRPSCLGRAGRFGWLRMSRRKGAYSTWLSWTMNSRLSFLSVSLFFFLRQFSQLVPFLNCAVECWVEFKACKWSFCSCILFCKPPLVIEALNCHMAKFSIHSKFGFESCNTHVHSNCNSKWSLHSLESIADFKRVVTDIFWQWLMVYPSTLKSPHNSLEFCSFSVSRFHALAQFIQRSRFECLFFFSPLDNTYFSYPFSIVSNDNS